MAIISGITVPKEVIRLIFTKMDPASLRVSSKVIKVFREIALDENLLKRLFPAVVLPKGMTIQQWLLQSIHSEEDLFKCLRQYMKKRGTAKEGLSLKLSSSSGESILVNYHVFDAVTSNGVPKKMGFFKCQTLEADTKELPVGSVILGSVHADIDTQKLRTVIDSKMFSYKKLPATKPAPGNNIFVMGAAAAALSIAAVVGCVFFSKSNNQ